MNRITIEKLKKNGVFDLFIIVKHLLNMYYKKLLTNITKQMCVIEKNKQNGLYIKNFQNNKLKEICGYAYKNSQYYNRILKNIDLNNVSSEFENIPLLDKGTIRKYEKQIVVRNLKPWKHYEVYTGGSTGQPLRLYLSPLVGIIDDAHQRYYAKYVGYRKGDHFITIGGNSVPISLRKNNIYWTSTPCQLPFGAKTYSILYFTQKTRRAYLNDFIKTEPAIIRGYPSAIYEFARYVNDEKIDIQFNIKGVILTSEQAFGWQVKEIEKIFKTSVYFQYGHTEACIFAYTL